MVPSLLYTHPLNLLSTKKRWQLKMATYNRYKYSMLKS